MTKSILSAIRWMYSWYDPEDPAVSSEELERLMTNFVLNGIKR